MRASFLFDKLSPSVHIRMKNVTKITKWKFIWDARYGMKENACKWNVNYCSQKVVATFFLHFALNKVFLFVFFCICRRFIMESGIISQQNTVYVLNTTSYKYGVSCFVLANSFLFYSSWWKTFLVNSSSPESSFFSRMKRKEIAT